MRLVSWVVLAACTKSAAPPETPSNTSRETAPSDEPASSSTHAFVPTGNSLALGPAGTCAVGGTTADKATGELLVGVTIVVSVGDLSEPVITDEKGQFLIHRADVPERIHAYYADVQAESAFRAAWCGQSLRIAIDQVCRDCAPIDVR